MARAKVVHSQDAVTVVFRGDPRDPEPSTGVIQFPGGHVEVSRHSDGRYWVHVEVVDPANVDESRIDYVRQDAGPMPSVDAMPAERHVKHIAVLVSRRFDRPPYDSGG